MSAPFEPIIQARFVRQRDAGRKRTEVYDTTWRTFIPVVPEGRKRHIVQGYYWNRDTGVDIFNARLVGNGGELIIQFKKVSLVSGNIIPFPNWSGDLVDQANFHMKPGDYCEAQLTAPSAIQRPEMWVAWYDEE